MKRILLFLPLAIMIVLLGCSIKKPGVPKWEVEVTIPIADKTYPMSDLVADSTDSLGSWVSQSGDTLFINYADTIERAVNEDSLWADSVYNTSDTQIGIVVVEAPGIEQAIYLLTEIDSTLQPGTYQVSPFSFPPTTEDMSTYDEFDWLIVAEKLDPFGIPVPDTNRVTVTFTNNCPFPFEDVYFELWGVDPPLLIYESFFEGIIDTGEFSAVTDTLLTDRRIDNEMYVTLYGDSPGSTSPVEITYEDHVNISVTLSPLTVKEAVAEVPAQIYDSLWVFQVESEDTVIAATFKKAYIDYHLTDYTGIYNDVTFTIPDLTDSLGEAFSNSLILPPYGTFDTTGVELTGYTLSAVGNEVQVQINSLILDSRDPTYYPYGSWVHVKNTDVINIAFSIYNPDNPDGIFTFSYFEAIMTEQVNELEPAELLIEDIPEGLDSINAVQAVLDVRLVSTLGVEVPIELEIMGYKKGVLKQTLFENLAIPAGNYTEPEDTVFTITNIVDFINILPDEIQVTGRYSVEGYVSIAEENFNGAYVEGSYLIYSPFSVWTGNTTLEPEITILDNGFENHLLEASMTLDLVSHVPLNGEAFILASYDSMEFDNPFSTEVDTFFHVALPEAEVDGNGYVINPGILTIPQVLNLAQLDLFASASEETPVYIKTYLTINSTQGQVVNFHPDDYITVGASAHLIIDIDPDELSEEGGN